MKNCFICSGQSPKDKQFFIFFCMIICDSVNNIREVDIKGVAG